MKKQNLKITFYNTGLSFENIDRALPIDQNGNFIELKDVLKNPIKTYDFDSPDIKKTEQLDTFHDLLITATKDSALPIANYAVIECKTDYIHNQKLSYFFVNHLEEYSEKFIKMEFSMDFIATFGAEYFTNLEGKFIEYNKRHIDRWVKDEDNDTEVNFKYLLSGFNSSVSNVSKTWEFYNGFLGDKTHQEMFTWMTGKYSNSDQFINVDKIVIGEDIHKQEQRVDDYIKIVYDSTATQGNRKLYFERYRDKARLYMDTHLWFNIITQAQQTVLNFVNTFKDGKLVREGWVITRDSTTSGDAFQIELPKTTNKVWDKKDIEKYINKHYGEVKIVTDLDAFLADNTKHTIETLDLYDNRYSQNFSVFKNLFQKDYLNILHQGEVGETIKSQIHSKEDLLFVLREKHYAEGLSQDIEILSFVGDNFTGGGYDIIIMDSKYEKPLPDRTYTYGDYIRQSATRESAYEQRRHLTEEVYVKYKTLKSVFKDTIDIIGIENQDVFGNDIKTLSKCLTTYIKNHKSVNPTEYNLVFNNLYDSSKLPKNIEKIEYVTHLGDNPRGVIIVEAKATFKNNYIMNSKKTNEIWTNTEYGQLLSADGSNTYQKNIPLFPKIDTTTISQEELETKILELPLSKKLPNKQRVYYTIASKLMCNKFTEITDQDFYAYAVISSTVFEEVANEFKLGKITDASLKKTYNIEEPYTYLPIINQKIEKEILAAVDKNIIFKNYIINSELTDRTTGYTFKGEEVTNKDNKVIKINSLKNFFKSVVSNNTHKNLKEKFGKNILRIILSPVPLNQRINPTRSSKIKSDSEEIIDTYFKVIKKDDVQYLALKNTVDFETNWLEIDFEDLNDKNEFQLPTELPKRIDNDYLKSNIEIALLNQTYEAHALKSMLSTTLISLNSRNYYNNKKLLVKHSLVSNGVDYDMRFKDQQNEGIFYEQDFSFPFSQSEALTILQQTKETNQARLDQIQRNTQSAAGSAGIQTVLGIAAAGLGFLTAPKTGAAQIAGLIGAGSIQGVGAAGGAAYQERFNDAAQRQEINATIADSAKRSPQHQDPIITESRLSSPFRSTRDTEQVGVNTSPFNLLITKPNQEIALKVAKAFNDNGYASNHSEYFNSKKIATRQYWNFIQISNIAQLTTNFDMSKYVISRINREILEGIRIHWFREGNTDIDRSLINYETALISRVKK